MIFIDKEHKNFYETKTKELVRNDAHRRALIYCLGICDQTRAQIHDLFDFNTCLIKLDGIEQPWQTHSTSRITRTAFTIYNDYFPTVRWYEDQGKKEEAETEQYEYALTELFATTEYIPYFVQALYIRFELADRYD